MRTTGIGLAAWRRRLALVGSLFAAGPSLAADPADVRLDRPTLAAQGRQSAVMTVGAFGRYAVSTKSSQGVALRLIDRMAGQIGEAGETGQSDGRLDLFLDRGDYQVVTQAATRGSGEVRLDARAFRELNNTPLRLLEERWEKATLGDFEQRSYWFEVKEAQTFAIEAGGRHLSDLRLWRDGLWLVDAKPQLLTGQVKAQQPLAIARLTLKLDPGLYLVTAYGGPSQPWTEASDARPFALRVGVPKYGPEMRQQFVMGELGVERFIVPASANYFRLELPAHAPATLGVQTYSPESMFAEGATTGSITKNSRLPVAELRYGQYDSKHERLLTVTGAPGQPYILQYFDERTWYDFQGAGDSFWIASTHAGHADDSVGASAVLTRHPWNGREELLAEQAIDLKGAWHRRFNLLDPLTVFIKIPSPTVLRINGEGAKAKYRLEPFMTSRPADYKTPDAHDSGHLFPVLGGLYVLTVMPETRGILDLHLMTGLSTRQSEITPVVAGVRFAETRLDAATGYRLYLNNQPGVPAGAVIRRLPIDPRAALPIVQRAGETVTVPITVQERGWLRARTEDGKLIELTAAGGKKGTSLDLPLGLHQITIAAAKAGRSFSLVLEPLRLDSATPLPPLPDTVLAGLPKFPALSAAMPAFLDLERQRSTTYSLNVDRPGLQRVESTGLLHTSGRIRTRVNPSLFDAVQNGVGNNFLIQRYLREGDYQLTVGTQGDTQGHLGLRLVSTPVVDGGELREGEVARAELPAEQAMAYTFKVARAGQYRLQAMGLGRNFEVRLEDEQGWPLAAPVQPGDISTSLAAGTYRLIVLPQTHAARLVTRLDRHAEPRRFKGHGPHPLTIGSVQPHLWKEAASKTKGAKKRAAPDEWSFRLPAPAELSLSLDGDVNASLIDLAAPKTPLATVDAGKPWRGSLPVGRYRVQVKPIGNNNLVDYTLSSATTQLLPGQSRSVAAPTTIPLSVGNDGLVEIESFGQADVRGRLLDERGEVVAQNDDRPGDWNFQIAQHLKPGAYRLQVDPIGERRAQTIIAVRAPDEVTEAALPLGQDVEVRDAKVHVFPLPALAGNVVQVSARSGDNVGLSLEGQRADGWVALGNVVDRNPYLAAQLNQGIGAYRVRVWSADRRSLKLTLRGVAATLPATPEIRWLQSGTSAQAIDPARPDIRLALVAPARPGVFRLIGELAPWRWSDSAEAARSARDAVLAVNGQTLLFAGLAPGADVPPLPQGERLRLPLGERDPLRVELAESQTGVIDLAGDGQSPSLLFARARTGQPGIGTDARRDPAAIGFVVGEAVSLVMPGIATPARLWNASGRQAIELDVRQLTLKPQGGRSLRYGADEGTLAAGAALPLSLPSASSRLRLSLAPSTAAIFTKNGRALSSHWSGGEAVQETVDALGADQLWLINAASEETRYALDVAPAPAGGDAADKPLRVGELFERNLATQGRLRIAIEAPKLDAGETPPRLRVAGHTQALWQERGGRIVAGDEFSLADTGALWVQHRPGSVAAWIEGGDDAAGFERLLRELGETRVTPPHSTRLAGKQKLLTFALDTPAMVQLRGDTPLVAQILRRGQGARTETQTNGARLNLPLFGGPASVLLRALGADALSGTLAAHATPMVTLTDGVGPEVLLGSGDARLFGFDLQHPATLGIGVRASTDVVRAVLYDTSGAVRAEGVVQMPTLPPGRYFLAVEAPPDSAPVKVRPIVLGLTRPDTRPPYDILRRYVEIGDEDGPPLIYVPPPPPPPPSAVASEESNDLQGQEGDGQEEGEAPYEGEGQEEAGEPPAEE